MKNFDSLVDFLLYFLMGCLHLHYGRNGNYVRTIGTSFALNNEFKFHSAKGKIPLVFFAIRNNITNASKLHH